MTLQRQNFNVQLVATEAMQQPASLACSFCPSSVAAYATRHLCNSASQLPVLSLPGGQWATNPRCIYQTDLLPGLVLLSYDMGRDLRHWKIESKNGNLAVMLTCKYTIALMQHGASVYMHLGAELHILMLTWSPLDFTEAAYCSVLELALCETTESKQQDATRDRLEPMCTLSVLCILGILDVGFCPWQ